MAEAGTVTKTTGPGAHIVFEAAAGEDNRLDIYEQGGFVYVTDIGAATTAGSGCEQLGSNARCSTAGLVAMDIAPAAGARCDGTLTLRRRARRVAKGRFDVAAGTTGTVRLRIPRRVRRSIGRRGLRVHASATLPSGASSRTVRLLKVRR